MILRRFTQALKDQNWAAIAIEFVLLVLGVFLGIQVANWNVERSFAKVDNSDFLAYVFSPDGKAVRAPPEFAAYLRAKGFPALWDKYGAPDMCRKDASGDYVCQ